VLASFLPPVEIVLQGCQAGKSRRLDKFLKSQAVVSRPIADDISVGHVMLRQPAPTALNLHIQSFAAHCEDIFSDWSQ
jgi:hypothetical protein